MDISGRLIFSEQLKTGVEVSTINLQDLQSGMYLYEISSNERAFEKGKLIINR